MKGLSGNSGMKPQVTKVSTYLFDMKISFKKPLREKKLFFFYPKTQFYLLMELLLFSKYDKNDRKLNILIY